MLLFAVFYWPLLQNASFATPHMPKGWLVQSSHNAACLRHLSTLLQSFQSTSEHPEVWYPISLLPCPNVCLLLFLIEHMEPYLSSFKGLGGCPFSFSVFDRYS